MIKRGSHDLEGFYIGLGGRLWKDSQACVRALGLLLKEAFHIEVSVEQPCISPISVELKCSKPTVNAQHGVKFILCY